MRKIIKILVSSVILFFILAQIPNNNPKFPYDKKINYKNDNTHFNVDLNPADVVGSVIFQGYEESLNITDFGNLYV